MRTAALLSLVLLTFAGPASAQDLFDLGTVRDFYFTFPQPSWWNDILTSKSTKQYVKGDLTVDSVTYKDVGLRIKGASSSSVPGVKKPFNLSLDEFVSGQELYGFDTLNLNNGAVDPTLTREVISYEIFRNYIPTPRICYVRVHLNNVYWGIYILVEQPDKKFVGDWFENDDGTRYKGDRPTGAAVGTSTLQWYGSAISNYTSRYEIKTPTHPDAWIDLVNLIDKLNNTPAASFETEIQKVCDVDRALWYFVVMNAVVNSDDYMGAGHNYYMYFDPADGRMNMIPWDLNEAFGVHGPSTNPWTYNILQGATSSYRPLVKNLLAVPEWRELYYAHYRTILNEWIDWNGKIGPLNTQLQTLIATDVAADTNYLYPGYFNPSFSGKVWLDFHWVHGLKEVTEGRHNYLHGQSNLTKPEPQISQVTQFSHKVNPGQLVNVTAKVTGSPAIATVELRSSQAGAFVSNAMFDDGLHDDGAAGDDVYGGSFVAGSSLATMRYYVLATNSSGTVQVEPKTAEHTFFAVEVMAQPGSGPVVINELLADNDFGDKDEFGDQDDWFEIHNVTGLPYDLSGHYLSDNAGVPKLWQVPAGTIIPGGGFLRVWADNEPGEGKYHATFKLDKSGDEIILTDTDAKGNVLIDAVAFGDQKGDRSYGRVPDGGAEWYFVWTPTGNAPVVSAPGWNRYDGRKGASPTDFDLDGSGIAIVGAQFSLDLEGGTPFGTALLFASLGPAQTEIPPYGIFNLDPAPPLWFFGLPLNGAGDVSLAGPVPASLAGITFYCQAASQDLTNGLMVSVSP